jgi:hypothetical protein
MASGKSCFHSRHSVCLTPHSSHPTGRLRCSPQKSPSFASRIIRSIGGSAGSVAGSNLVWVHLRASAYASGRLPIYFPQDVGWFSGSPITPRAHLPASLVPSILPAPLREFSFWRCENPDREFPRIGLAAFSGCWHTTRLLSDSLLSFPFETLPHRIASGTDASIPPAFDPPWPAGLRGLP